MKKFADTLCLFDVTPGPIFPLCFKCTYSLLYILLNQNWRQDQIQYETYQKNVLFPLPGIDLLVYRIYFRP